MATVPEGYAQPEPETVGPRFDLYSWVTTTDHKRIGILYLLTTGMFFVVGGIEALIIRLQLALPHQTLITPGSYNELFTMHGTTMIFLVVMPMLLGFGNYMLPLMIGARDMAFPRLNALSYWMLLFGGIFLYFSFLTGSAPNTGWFSYAPLTEHPFSLSKAVDFWALGILVTSFGTIATGINLVVTTLKERAPGMTLMRMPIFVWMLLFNGVLILGAIPALTAAQVMLLFDRHLGTPFFVPARAGDPILWQHLFWYFGHPEVYIMVLPAFGMISEIVPVFSRKPIFGYPLMVVSGGAIMLLSLSVWAHHMFTVGLGSPAVIAFGLTSMTIAVPTGIKIFTWLGTMWGGRIRLRTAMLFAIAFVVQFTVGGITGVQFALVPLDWQVHDSYYVVAHFHYVLFGGSAFGMLAATYYWFPKISGRMLSERLGKLVFVLAVVGFNVTFFPMHILGLMGQPRRTFSYPNLPGWGAINFIETIGAFILGGAVLLLLWDVQRTLRSGQPAGNNPWEAWTLEWATTSPPPPENFASPLPPVHSARPLFDVAHPEARQPTGTAVEVGRAAARALDRVERRIHVATSSLGVLALCFSELTFFGALIAAFLEYRYRSPSGPTPRDLDVLRTGLFSIALWASSGTAIWATRRLRRGDQRGFRLWLLITIGLGVIFLIGQITEFLTMYRQGITIDQNLFTASFFTLVGFHGFHVFLGVVALSIVAGLALAGRDFAPQHREGIEAVSIYWHFVDLVWVVIFTLVYLLSL